MSLTSQDIYRSLDSYLEKQACAGTLQELQRTVLSKGQRAIAKDGHWPIVDFPLAIHRALRGSFDVGLAVLGACLLFYGFADITDDAQDHDLSEEAWGHWGWPQAVNTGSSLLFLSQVYLYDHLEPRLAASISQAFLRTGLEMTHGQHVDLIGQDASCPTLSSYLQTVEQKSGASFGMYLQAVAMVNELEPERIAAFRELGRSLGAMFQMISDVYELWKTTELSSDFANRRLSYPIVLGFEQLQDPARTRFRELLEAPPTLLCQQELVSLLDESGIRAYSTLRCEVYRRRARLLAQQLGVAEEPYVAGLIDFPAFPETSVSI